MKIQATNARIINGVVYFLIKKIYLQLNPEFVVSDDLSYDAVVEPIAYTDEETAQPLDIHCTKIRRINTSLYLLVPREYLKVHRDFTISETMLYNLTISESKVRIDEPVTQ